MTDPILEVRMWLAFLIVFCGVFLPFICLMCIYIYNPKYVKYYHLIGLVCIAVLTVIFGRDLIPEKYDIETIKVYQCEYIEKIVPKYTIK